MSETYPFKPSPWVWEALDADQTAELWADLDEWVQWLRRRYDLGSKIRPCWFLHPVWVDELLAAMVAWRAAYQKCEPESLHHNGLSMWFQQSLWPMISRCQSNGGAETCTQLECNRGPIRVASRTDFDEFVAHHVAQRPAPNTVSQGDPATLNTLEVMALVDTGAAVHDDPDDEFSPIEWEGRRYNYDEDSEKFAVEDGYKLGSSSRAPSVNTAE